MMVLIILSAVLMLAFQCTVSDVVNDFGKCTKYFMEGQPPQIEGILVDSKSADQNRYKIICQRYEKDVRFATLYDIKNRIPVFSAYQYSGKGDFKRKDLQENWMIEPQLESEMNEPHKMLNNLYNQASDEDYKNKKFDRGHLFPASHAHDELTCRSTFTLTNIVPQYKSFNQHSWSDIEKSTTGLMNTNCIDKSNKVSAYVITGAVPGNNELNGKVNIPSMMWTAFCCKNKKNSWFSKAHWATNNDDKKKIKKTEEGSLEDLVNALNKEKLNVKQIFKNNCN
ncbi:endonuclease domain-containing 1 protein-like [Myxocyprinus asiaticus]|uniref:endonuclease domain-containing 1 protein-like n=1 Tax=Myxocyprinus asiaticus TaxID=70543 RepID=UPI002223EADC|nr:endonuclease domain-containing 1 protein-like [Myxocyprinus asiaticus]